MSNSADLVGRLHYGPPATQEVGERLTTFQKLCDEAAAEIVRLRQRKISAPRSSAPHNSGERLPSSDAAGRGADTLASESKLREIEAETREACAKICSAHASELRATKYLGFSYANQAVGADDCAAAIRSHASQGEKK